MLPFGAVARARKIPVRRGTDFLDQRMVVAYNLNLCRPGRPSRPGEACFTVRPKPGGPVTAYVRSMALRDVRPRILPAALERIRRTRQREVCCYIEGTVIRPEAVQGELVPVRFNPFRSPCFHTSQSPRCWSTARYALFEGRRMYVVDPVYPRRQNEALDPGELDVGDPFRAAVLEYVEVDAFRAAWPSREAFLADLATETEAVQCSDGFSTGVDKLGNTDVEHLKRRLL